MAEKMELTDKDTRTRIFLTAAELFSTHGYDRVSIRQICEQVGVGKPTLYYYFNDKETLLAELIKYSWSIGKELVEEYVLKNEDFFDRLYGMLKVNQKFVREHPRFVRFAVMLNINTMPESVRDLLEEISNEKMSQSREIFQQAMDHGYINPDYDIKYLIWTVMGTMNHLVVMEHIRPDLQPMSDTNLKNLFEFWKQHLFNQPLKGGKA